MFLVGALVGLSGYWLVWYGYVLVRGPAGIGLVDLITPSQNANAKVDEWLALGGSAKGMSIVSSTSPTGGPSAAAGGTAVAPGTPGASPIVPGVNANPSRGVGL